MDRVAYEVLAETEDHHWWFAGRRRIIERQLIKLGLPDSATIVELGAGTGGNLEMLRRHGHVSAMELDDEARAVASQKSGIEVLPGSLPDRIPFADGSADVVGLFDVLEHVADDARALSEIRRLLKRGGALLLTVPANQRLWSAHDERMHHFRRYSRLQLSDLLRAAGFTLSKLSYYNTFLFPIAAAIRLANIKQATGNVAGEAIPAKPLNAALKAVLHIESSLIDHANLPFGLSLIAVARKSSTA